MLILRALSSPQIASSLVYSFLLNISAFFDQVLGGRDTHSQGFIITSIRIKLGGSDTHSQGVIITSNRIKLGLFIPPQHLCLF
ncbi:hypothetical protein FB446DRAFT_848861 [Lentinula raphanica]|nr:hypothetical protein FB446DRAFT_848861 [Lentinula raphanica]